MNRAFGFLLIVCCFLLHACNRVPDALTAQPSDTLVGEIKSTATLEESKEARMSRETIDAGNLIVNAVERFYKDKGYYPQTLYELVPDYIDEVPVTAIGGEFRYILLEPENILGRPYNLSFDSPTNTYVGCVYLQKFQTWDCSFSIDTHE